MAVWSPVVDDREMKAPLYARAGIGELWLVDLAGERIEIHREPEPRGYRLVRIAWRSERISPLFAPELEIDVDAILEPTSDD